MCKATVIIPTTGAEELELAVQSVLNQTVSTRALVVFDGQDFERPLALPHSPRITKLTLPFNTGKSRTATIHQSLPRHWYGSRAMTAAAYVVNDDYSMILDQDNWLRPDHVELCINALGSRPMAPYQFVHSLRNIYRKDGSFVCRDDCESLGKHKGVSGNLIDTSCYFYRTDFLLHTAHMWLWGWGSDRVYMQRVVQSFGDDIFTGTGRYTMNYRLGGNDGSVKEALFVRGNAKNHAAYATLPMPWASE
jgi:hypothetical protein